MKRIQNRGIAYAAIFILAIAIAVCIVIYLADAAKKYRIQGEIEVGQCLVLSNASGQVVDLYVKEGDFVNIGDTLAVIDNSASLSQYKDATAQRYLSQPDEITEARRIRTGYQNDTFDMWQQALAGVDVARKNLERVEQLFEKGFVSEQERSDAYLTFKAMEAQERAARKQYDMICNEAHTKFLSNSSYYLDGNLNEIVLTSQAAGEINRIYVTEGQNVNASTTLMTVSVMTDVYTTFSVPEDMLYDMNVGDTFTAFCPAFNKDFELKVYSLKNKGISPAKQASIISSKANVRTFEVRARLTAPFDGLRPGMTLLARNR